MSDSGGPGIVDGFVRELLDEELLAARLRWVATGDPAWVAACGRGQAAEGATP
ncbi:hypothetical protein ACIRP7_10230 [Streptomyces sp. NPDC102270]|uniref:hypothetical protein n=1 Tax=Streptomyces sp. NPDC102270 TaxID=3366150 RepID=UPI00381D1C49